MQKNLEIREASNGRSLKKSTRCRSFYFRYLELCRAKNLIPLPDICAKNHAKSKLDLYGDKLDVKAWLLIFEALHQDQLLKSLCIRLRKSLGMVLEHLDTEGKAKLFKQKPVVYTKFIFTGLVNAVVSSIEFNKNLRVLKLEGLPLSGKYVQFIAKALLSNESLKEISFQRSNICDPGCEAICNAMKYMDNVSELNLAACELSTKAAEYVADMIKIQKISRFIQSWQKSLRYRDIDPNILTGLRSISLAHNPKIGDDGVKSIVDELKDDVWIKVIDMEYCGLTDLAAQLILECLDLNNCINEFKVRGNSGMSNVLQRSISEKLGRENEEKLLHVTQQNVKTICKNSMVNVSQLIERRTMLEKQLALERALRKRAELLNEKLNLQIIDIENKLETAANVGIPEGYVMVKNESLQEIIRERNHFQKIISDVCNINSKAVSVKKIKHKPKYIHQKIHKYTIKEVPPNVVNVRKVKSEMKYVDKAFKSSAKKQVTRSDHTLGNEPDVSLFFQREVYQICSSYVL